MCAFGANILAACMWLLATFIVQIVCDRHGECVVRNLNVHGYGRWETSPNGFKFCSYQRIPYAQSPINRLAHKPPRPYPRFTQPKSFVDEPPACTQMTVNFSNFTGHLNCLFLNVYAPLKKRNGKYVPVMVFIHGGSFNVGSSHTDHNGVDFFVEQGIVVVTFNYRLGPVGFLKIPDAGIPGNAGLKDQQAALRWVQKNIAAFGGDYRSVTLAGWSAGAASVTYHMYAPSSRGLFHRAIAMSGTMLAPWAFNERVDCQSKRFANLFNIWNPSGADVDMMNREDDIDEAMMFNHLGTFHLSFIPTIENSNGSTNVFMTKSPDDMLRDEPTSRVPLLIGHTSVEFAKIFQLFAGLRPLPCDRIECDRSKQISQLSTVYLNGQNAGDSLERLTMMADMYYPIWRFATEYADKSDQNVFVYRFAFDGEFRKSSYDTEERAEAGAMHGDELGYLFKPTMDGANGLTNSTVFHREIVCRRKMIELWTNFIKFGNPTPPHRQFVSTKWLPLRKDNPRYLNIDETVEMRDGVYADTDYTFWDEIHKCLNDNDYCSRLKSPNVDN